METFVIIACFFPKKKENASEASHAATGPLDIEEAKHKPRAKCQKQHTHTPPQNCHKKRQEKNKSVMKQKQKNTHTS